MARTVTPIPHTAAELRALRGPGLGRRAVRLARKSPMGAVGLGFIVALIVIGVFGPALAPHEINEFAGLPNQSPSTAFPFGTDKFGQDIFSRVIHGARVSLQVSVLSVIGGTFFGLLIGSFSGYKGGKVDTVIQRIMDTLIAFPALILLLIIVRLFEPSLRNVIIVIGIVIIPGNARVIRSAALAERNNQYVEAAQALGGSDLRILLRHIIPNLLPLAIVLSTTLLGTAILAEASLSFLGLGVPPPNPSWGSDISAARTAFPLNVWLAFFPGLAITLTVLGFNLLGDGLRDIVDPQRRT